jgi:hypothetical protein
MDCGIFTHGTGVLVHPGHHGSVNPKEFEFGEMVNYTRDGKIW